jgi:hypothetical protein
MSQKFHLRMVFNAQVTNRGLGVGAKLIDAWYVSHTRRLRVDQIQEKFHALVNACVAHFEHEMLVDSRDHYASDAAAHERDIKYNDKD